MVKTLAAAGDPEQHLGRPRYFGIRADAPNQFGNGGRLIAGGRKFRLDPEWPPPLPFSGRPGRCGMKLAEVSALEAPADDEFGHGVLWRFAVCSAMGLSAAKGLTLKRYFDDGPVGRIGGPSAASLDQRPRLRISAKSRWAGADEEDFTRSTTIAEGGTPQVASHLWLARAFGNERSGEGAMRFASFMRCKLRRKSGWSMPSRRNQEAELQHQSKKSTWRRTESSV